MKDCVTLFCLRKTSLAPNAKNVYICIAEIVEVSIQPVESQAS